jgi:hypothetical protein
MKQKGFLCLTIIFLLQSQLLSGPADKSRKAFSGFDKGCFSVSYNLFPSFVSAINDDVENFGLDKFDKELFMTGLEMVGNMNPAFGIGIHYYFGSKDTQGIVQEEIEGSLLDLDRLVRYDVSFFGLGINYRKSLMGRMEFYGGFSAGYGSVAILISQDVGDQSYEDMWSSFGESELHKRFNKSSYYETPMYVFRSDNGIKFYMSERIAVGISAGYVYSLVSDNGEINYGFETLKNVPGLDFDGWTLGTSIYFGY